MKQTHDNPTITILGAGFVGLTSAAMFARAGLKTYIVDVNEKRLEAARQGKAFFYEEGLNPLIEHGVKNDMLIPTSSYKDAVTHSDIIISAVGTPDNPDGSSNLSYVFASAEEAAKYMKPDAVYAQKSTVPAGTGAKVKQLFKKMGVQATYVSNPEFLRESTAVYDSLWFDRIVVGGDDDGAVDRLMAAYRQVQKKREDIAATAGITGPKQLPAEQYIPVSLETAELIKVASNAFLAMKISFANSMAKLADKAGANVVEIMDVVGADPRIGRAFLNAGRGYGGGCFPKDVSGLISSAAGYGIDLPIMTAVSEVNDSMPGYIINKAQEALGGISGKRIAVLGLAFKAKTSDMRRSPGIKMANMLAHDGAVVTAYDPKANGEAEAELRKGVKLCNTMLEAIKNADAVFIATDWQEFLEYDLSKAAQSMRGDVFVDCMNAFSGQHVAESGLEYIGVGRQ